jgi:Putative peptidoglycan binding domain/L,D-transpeptidase catalytic domain
MDVRRALPLGLLLLVFPGAAHAATLTLRAEPGLVRYGQPAAFAGELAPAQAGVAVALYAQSGTSGTLVATAATLPDGSYRFSVTPREAGSYFAVAQVDPATQATSAPAALRMRPTLTAAVRGRRLVGERIVLTGRLLPATAGRLRVTIAGRTRRVAVGPAGRYRYVTSAPLPGRLRFALTLRPGAGYETMRRRAAVLVRAPNLAWGSAGNAVRALEARLRELHYVIRGVDSRYGSDTYEAVMAFQKVNGLSRTGRASAAVWARLARAGVPRAFVPRGTHIEISKTKQVMYEVVNGTVVRAVHVSTGATGNTPVGRWRVYRLGPGYNALGMYYSLYFLRGFAIHGYRSVPPWPASHGCIRTPIWYAPGFYQRWARIGTQVYVFP